MSEPKKDAQRIGVAVGVVVEIPTKRGLAYAQMSHDHATHGALLRVLPGFHASRPLDVCALVSARESFVAFFPLELAVQRKIFELVAQCEVPEAARAFPVFRIGIPDPTTRKVKLWWFWDGAKEWRVGSISAAQRALPLREVCDEVVLVRRIEEGWTPQNDPR